MDRWLGYLVLEASARLALAVKNFKSDWCAQHGRARAPPISMLSFANRWAANWAFSGSAIFCGVEGVWPCSRDPDMAWDLAFYLSSENRTFSHKDKKDSLEMGA